MDTIEYGTNGIKHYNDESDIDNLIDSSTSGGTLKVEDITNAALISKNNVIYFI